MDRACQRDGQSVGELSQFAVAALTTCCISTSFAAIQPMPKGGRMPTINPTDSVSRAVPAHELKGSLVARVPAGADPSATIHREFPQIIEQNFAHYAPETTTRGTDGMTFRELHDLAANYNRAVADSAHKPMLLALLAQRLDAAHLASLSQHFGYMEVDDAVKQYAPEKEANFSQIALSTYGTSVAASPPYTWGPTDTPTELYSDLRTAPLGIMATTTAIFEAGIYMGAIFAYVWSIQKAADGVTYLLQTYDPSLYDAIGGTIAVMVDNLWTNSSNVSKTGSEEQSGSKTFQTPPSQTSSFEDHGGDYDSTADWEVFFGGCGYLKTAPPGAGGVTQTTYLPINPCGD